jgi:hypothetical protein
LNSTKAQGPDGVPAWLVKENADCLAEPISHIHNCSFQEGCLPPSWKRAGIVPVPKKKTVKEVNKDLRPISLTPNTVKSCRGLRCRRVRPAGHFERFSSSHLGQVKKLNLCFSSGFLPKSREAGHFFFLAKVISFHTGSSPLNLVSG